MAIRNANFVSMSGLGVSLGTWVNIFVLILLAALLSACQQQSASLADIGRLARTLHQCRLAQEVPGECQEENDALRDAKLDVLSNDKSLGEIETAIHLSIEDIPGDLTLSHYNQVRKVIAASEVPVETDRVAFDVFSNNFTCSDVKDALVLVQRKARSDRQSRYLGDTDAFIFKSISEYAAGNSNRSPCLALSDFPNGAFVVSSIQFEELRQLRELDDKRVSFELVGEHEAAVLKEEKKKSKLQAEMSRLKALYPDRYSCKPDDAQSKCFSVARYIQLRRDAEKSLGIPSVSINGLKWGPKAQELLFSYPGEWCWSDPEGNAADGSMASIFISLRGNGKDVVGRHCITDARGYAVDCVKSDEAAPTIQGTWRAGVGKLRIESASNDVIGEAVIQSVKEEGDGMQWTQTKAAGNFLPERTIVLSKCSSTR